MPEELDIELSQPNHEVKLSAMEVSQQREQLANTLREKHPGEWAVVSKGHTSRGAARQVRDRIKGRPCWRDFEWSVCQHPDNAGLHRILAKAPGGSPFVPPSLPVEPVPADEISPLVPLPGESN